MKRILITGKNSYIGTSVEKWLLKEPSKYAVDTIDMENRSWRKKDFSKYDVVFHVAGIAHVSSDPKMKDLYYEVNTELTIETAKKAKREGVVQFIFMSSIIVYGDVRKRKGFIDKETIPIPKDFYGDSKLQAEKGVSNIATNDFNIVILRPPMIYGKGSKGNYPRLAKLARKLPLFPDFNNQRSMLHIDNLCEFIKVVIDYQDSGILFPQNSEYVKTSELVKEIADIHGKNIWLTKIFNPILKLIFRVNVIQKVFGDLVYDKSMSEYKKTNYRIRSFRESIKATEK